MKYTPHSFKPVTPAIKGFSWPVCTNCGLVKANNALTAWCIKNGCDYDEAPGYKQACKTLPKQGRK